MINETKAARITAGVEAGSVLPGLSNYSEADLYKLRAEIDALLPSMGDLNLENEVTELYVQAKSLYQRTMQDGDVAPNQTAQTLNSCSAALQALVKMQLDLKRDEQMKRIEMALVEAVAMLPEESRDLFFAEYEKVALKHRATT